MENIVFIIIRYKLYVQQQNNGLFHFTQSELSEICYNV